MDQHTGNSRQDNPHSNTEIRSGGDGNNLRAFSKSEVNLDLGKDVDRQQQDNV
jgi:hypothetical protein